MYLKSIRAQGFKSFADKLDLEINPGITGIVGPNGSGKSNIVDAVRWVLGENSIKSLRSGTNTDVIFAGSSTREGSKRAMVALTFDNTDNYLKSEFKEVEIKRVVYKTGENEYYINNTKVRHKDITNLFMDTGAGTSAFNIISQGNVTNIINSKSTDRRTIFESAAGVLKYKSRKEESLKKLQNTEENLNSIKLVIDELKKTVTPLKKQSETAKKYLNIKNELESIDIALIAKDITDLNLEYNCLKTEIDTLKEKLLGLTASSEPSKLESLKLKNIELDELLETNKNELLKLTEELSNLNSEKKLTIERGKYEVKGEAINANLLQLKEQKLEIEKKISVMNNEVKDIESSIKNEREKLETVKNELLVAKVKRSTTNNTLLEKQKSIFILENRIDILENNIMSANNTPMSVKNILNNPRLRGIHNTIGKLIEIPDEYLVATDIALGAGTSYIVVDDEYCATDAIKYLKDNKLGRATFYPLNIIKSKNIPNDIWDEIKNINGVIGILSNLISYEKRYQNIIENQLGNVIVVNNADTLNIIGKLINYKYRIVSLDGEISHAGGSITGGTSKKNSMLNEKNELNKLKTENQNLKITINSLTKDLEELDKTIQELEDKETVFNKYIVLLNDELFNKKTNLSKSIDEESSVNSELEGIKDLKENKLDKHLEELIANIQNISKEKDIKEAKIKTMTKEKQELQEEINILEKKVKETSSTYNNVNNDLKNKEVSLGKLEVKLDNLLGVLNNDYNLTYEYAEANYSLDLEYELAKEKVATLKKELSSLGNVNTGSIEEYERINKRYEFLNKGKEDLEASSNELKDIIKEMDSIMISKFSKSFTAIQKEFSRIFKVMFHGGKGELALSNPEDLLNTGIDIIAIPPGKKINSPVALSGGEKALTAICLLFAMLEVRPSPFVILDEAEAALDEVNVDMFGKYLTEEKKHSQFILITHKKRMMEYADCLYGMTMQESGVSKIVSAKLES